MSTSINIKQFILIFVVVSTITGCSLTSKYQRPTIDEPYQWQSSSNEYANNEITNSEAGINAQWWQAFASNELDQFMQQALNQNYDLRAGIEQVKQARASLKIAGSNLWPSLDGSASRGRNRTNPPAGEAITSNAVQGGLSLSYELDLFGANRATRSAADASYQASLFDYQALHLLTVGSVAQAYFLVVNLNERLSITEQNLGNANEVLAIIQARADIGVESGLTLAQQLTAVANSEANRESLRLQRDKAGNALAVLLGKPPQTITVKAQSLIGLEGDSLVNNSLGGDGDETEGIVVSGIAVPYIAPLQPANLLERRPDIRVAEFNLIGANADIGVARAAFFPSISLGLGSTASAIEWGDPTTKVLSILGSLSVPLFKGHRLRGGLEKANARQRELLIRYYQAILNAYQEVEDALASVRESSLREKYLRVAMLNATKAHELSTALYDVGRIDFQTLLDTQDAQLSAQDAYSQVRLERLNAAISLYLALGGGWQEDQLEPKSE